MTLALAAVAAGLALLLWSADRFVEGAANLARHLGLPALLIGVVIVGFGTSAPEMVVSAMAALDGNPGLALGNAYGSNITNIGLILGLTALLAPVSVHSGVVRKELPLLAAATALAAWQLGDGTVSRPEALLLLAAFFLVLGYSTTSALHATADPLAAEVEAELAAHAMGRARATFWLVVGLAVLVMSSRLLVWGAVEIARGLGVSDLVIGLTVVALGTSLPELASALMAARKGEHDLVLGNVIGSNLFNTLAVVGIAGSIAPMTVGSEVLSRDLLATALLTLFLFPACFDFRGRGGRVNRWEGVLLLTLYAGYLGWLAATATARPA
ncbi:MAG: sodium:calcium antiporter [Porticoccaceae bacterium]|nr:MAG: sodium:calcium antiporter [Porticoccaceae bacterium]